MNPRKYLAATIAAALIPSPALAWGKTGHRVVAAIADAQLSGLTQQASRLFESRSAWMPRVDSNHD